MEALYSALIRMVHDKETDIQACIGYLQATADGSTVCLRTLPQKQGTSSMQ
jgi:hypothetical protein